MVGIVYKIPIEFFTHETEEILATGDEDKKNKIKRERISFFKSKGIDLGNEYDEYLRSKEARAVWPEVQLADRIASIRTKHFRKYRYQYLEQTGSYAENKSAIDALNLIDQDNYCPQFIEDSVICMCPNASEIDGTVEAVPVVHIPIFHLLARQKDVTLIHEIGHAIELQLIEATSDVIQHKTGFEYLVSNLTQNTEYVSSRPRRQFETISEVIHQKLAMDVTDLLHSQGVYLLGAPETETSIGSTSYEGNYPLVKDFFEMYRQEIIDARMQDEDFQAFTRRIPSEIIEQLNDLLRQYNELPHSEIAIANYEKRVVPAHFAQQRLLQEQRQLMDKLARTTTEPLLLASAIKATEESMTTGRINDAVQQIREDAREIEQSQRQRGED